MNHENSLHAMALKVQQDVPRWYHLSLLRSPAIGLKLTIHVDTWRAALTRCKDSLNTQDFKITAGNGYWICVEFPFPAGTTYDGKDCRSLQRTIAILFDAISCARKHPHPKKHQLIACGTIRSVNELKGYLLDVYVSYEMKYFLAKANVGEMNKFMTNAMKKATRRLGLPILQECCIAVVQNRGFLYLGIGDGSGTLLAAEFREREYPDALVGYVMTSDNIDNPALQLVFLYVLAAISAWGEKQQ